MITSKYTQTSCKKAKHKTYSENVLLKKIDVVTIELPKRKDTEDQLITLQEELNRLRTEKLMG